jgi:hypothetical protein
MRAFVILSRSCQRPIRAGGRRRAKPGSKPSRSRHDNAACHACPRCLPLVDIRWADRGHVSWAMSVYGRFCCKSLCLFRRGVIRLL